MSKYVSTKEAAERLGVCQNTVREYANAGKIDYIRTPGGQRRYRVDSLERQVQYLRECYPGIEVVKDCASALNDQRKGLKSVLGRCLRGEKLDIVVAHRDQLARFGFERIEWLVNECGGSILVLDQSVREPERELTEDLLTLIHVFSCRLYGFRNDKSKKNQAVAHEIAEAKDKRGFNVRALGPMRFSEALPMTLRDGRMIKYAGKWSVALPVLKSPVVTENQGRLVALDPGIRSFQTFFSDQFAGHLGQQDIQRIVRLARHLDRLLSRRDKTKSKSQKQAFTAAADQIREKIKNLISEIHWKVARFLTDNFDVILLPTFETKGMVAKGARKLRKTSVRSLLSFSHDKFGQRLEQKCIERGKKLVRVCEAYTSKTASWTGEMLKIGGAKQIRSEGVTVNRDINGARGIFLRALVDSPTLIEGAR